MKWPTHPPPPPLPPLNFSKLKSWTFLHSISFIWLDIVKIDLTSNPTWYNKGVSSCPPQMKSPQNTQLNNFLNYSKVFKNSLEHYRTFKNFPAKPYQTILNCVNSRCNCSNQTSNKISKFQNISSQFSYKLNSKDLLSFAFFLTFHAIGFYDVESNVT